MGGAGEISSKLNKRVGGVGINERVFENVIAEWGWRLIR